MQGLGLLFGPKPPGPRYNVDDIPVDRLHLERALDDDSAARGVTGHRALVSKKFRVCLGLLGV